MSRVWTCCSPFMSQSVEGEMHFEDCESPAVSTYCSYNTCTTWEGKSSARSAYCKTGPHWNRRRDLWRLRRYVVIDAGVQLGYLGPT
jgi:hypothetical protein